MVNSQHEVPDKRIGRGGSDDSWRRRQVHLRFPCLSKISLRIGRCCGHHRLRWQRVQRRSFRLQRFIDGANKTKRETPEREAHQSCKYGQEESESNELQQNVSTPVPHQEILRTNSFENVIVFPKTSSGSLRVDGSGEGGAPLKSDCTVAEFGVDGTAAPRIRSCHGIQRIVLAAGGGSAEITSRVFCAVSMSAGAVIQPGNELLICTRSRIDGTSFGDPVAAAASTSAIRACSGPSSRILVKSCEAAGSAKSVFVNIRFSS